MKIYIAADKYNKDFFPKLNWNFNRLDSFHYIKNNPFLTDSIHKYPSFILDSGAFTFLNAQSNQDVNFEDYVLEYADFINKHNIDLFFELDVDSVSGYEKVLEFRKLLELKTGKKCIPVWHKSRGLDAYKRLIKNYDYIAIGGIVTKEIKRSEYKIFTHLLTLAKSENCKVHGLGFTGPTNLRKYKFYSVDSASWLYGSMIGCVYKYQDGDILKIPVPPGQKIKTKQACFNDLKQWIKFSNFANKNL